MNDQTKQEILKRLSTLQEDRLRRLNLMKLAVTLGRTGDTHSLPAVAVATASYVGWLEIIDSLPRDRLETVLRLCSDWLWAAEFSMTHLIMAIGMYMALNQRGIGCDLLRSIMSDMVVPEDLTPDQLESFLTSRFPSDVLSTESLKRLIS